MLWLLLSAWAAPLALDAGSDGSPVFEGFQHLGPLDCDAPGCSWVVPPRKHYPGSEPDPLAGDRVRGGTLHLDLPAGSYKGWAMVGARDSALYYTPQTPIGRDWGIVVDEVDAVRVPMPSGLEYLQHPQRVGSAFPQFGEGLTEWDRQVAEVVEWIPFEFTADADGVDIQVQRIDLQALVIASEADAIEGEVMVEAANYAQRIYYHDYVNRSAATWAIPDLGEGPLSVQLTNWRALPDSAEATEQPAWSMQAFRGTRTGQIAWFFGNDDPVQFQVDGLDGLEIETGEVHWLDIRSDYELNRQPRPAFVRPEEHELRGGQGATVGLGFTVIVPDDARAKTYTGTVTATRGDETLSIPVTVDVPKLDLAPTPFEVGYFADIRSPAAQAYGLFDPRVLDVWREDVRLMRERGSEAVGLRLTSGFYDFVNSGTEEVGPSIVAEATQIWREAGGNRVVWIDSYFALAYDGAFRAPQKIDPDIVDAMIQSAVENDIDLFIYDEGGGRSTQETRLGNRVVQAFRNKNPDVRLAGALEHPRDWPYSDRYDLVMHTHRPPPSAARTAAIRGTGAESWSYNMMPGRVAPVAAWAMKPDGLLTWHWNDPVGNSFSDVDRRVDYQRSFYAPDGETVWPGTLANAFGEGVVDLRVLATLEREVERAEARGKDASRGRAILQTAPQAFENLDPVGPFDNARVHPEGLAWLRQAAVTEALRLQRGRRLRPGDAPQAGEITAEFIGWGYVPTAGRPNAPSPDLPYATGPEPVIDGVLDDETWTLAPNGPSLGPGITSKGMPTGEMGLLITDTGLAVGIRDLAPLTYGRVGVDATGTGMHWLELEIPRRDGPVNVRRCSYDGDAPPAPRGENVLATHCVSTGLPVGERVGDVVEALVPWTAFPHTSAELGVNWWIKDGDAQGTSIDGGGLVLVPGPALRNLETADLRGTLVARTDVLNNRWTIEATVPAPAADEEWVWEMWHFGEIVEHGTVAVAAGQTNVTVHVPEHPFRNAWFTIRGPSNGPLHPVAVRGLPKPDYMLGPGTPVAGDYQDVSTHLSNTVADVTVETLWRGEVLGQTTATVHGGTHTLRIRGATGDAVRLTFPNADGEPAVHTIPFVPLDP